MKPNETRKCGCGDSGHSDDSWCARCGQCVDCCSCGFLFYPVSQYLSWREKGQIGIDMGSGNSYSTFRLVRF